MSEPATAVQTQLITKGGTMPKAATIPATQQSHSVRRGQQITVAGITLIPLGRDRFHVIAPVGCRIDVEPVGPINVESEPTTHPSDRQEP